MMSRARSRSSRRSIADRCGQPRVVDEVTPRVPAHRELRRLVELHQSLERLCLVAQGRHLRAFPETRHWETWDDALERNYRAKRVCRCLHVVRTGAGPSRRIDALRSVYETFTEGVDTPDHVEARTLLDEVEAPVM